MYTSLTSITYKRICFSRPIPTPFQSLMSKKNYIVIHHVSKNIDKWFHNVLLVSLITQETKSEVANQGHRNIPTMCAGSPGGVPQVLGVCWTSSHLFSFCVLGLNISIFISPLSLSSPCSNLLLNPSSEIFFSIIVLLSSKIYFYFRLCFPLPC